MKLGCLSLFCRDFYEPVCKMYKPQGHHVLYCTLYVNSITGPIGGSLRECIVVPGLSAFLLVNFKLFPTGSTLCENCKALFFYKAGLSTRCYSNTTIFTNIKCLVVKQPAFYTKILEIISLQQVFNGFDFYSKWEMNQGYALKEAVICFRS